MHDLHCNLASPNLSAYQRLVRTAVTDKLASVKPRARLRGSFVAVSLWLFTVLGCVRRTRRHDCRHFGLSSGPRSCGELKRITSPRS